MKFRLVSAPTFHIRYIKDKNNRPPHTRFLIFSYLKTSDMRSTNNTVRQKTISRKRGSKQTTTKNTIMGKLVFYEGNGGSQEIKQVLSDAPGQDLRASPNDEHRSVKLLNVREGCIISVFDRPDGGTSDDFCIIEVKRSSPEYIVATFERSYEDDDVLVSYARHNGLDGKVSRIRVN